MSGAVIAAIVQLAGFAGVKLSPFKAGAIVAGVAALVVGLSLTAAGVHLFNAGYESADGEWREKALESQLAAARADQAAARLAAADAEARAASILQKAEQERAGTDAYVEDLRKRNEALASAGVKNVCGLTCDDLRGMRINSAACAAPAGVADVPAGAGGKRRWPLSRRE
ncbi:protease IV [Bradyrhizobium sp. BR 10261]|uniref:protease IV n=1 Tax=Bradyrhizobium sp. BR 10261 TaxID=2749992 RepID=UPI001C654380|nr:protease IV [Bradyrhizobium sp. BR 10261]MBW7967593.1 protease IV [Bradyrhizobium sp. BR 10261]